jgi:hypothetical protein
VGADRTIVVTAVDATSGQPVDGTVAIRGATGKTGAPITYSCGAEADVGVGARAVRRPPPICTGTVQAAGYRPVPIRY